MAEEEVQDSITYHLRDVIPKHDEDLDEAMEVYNYVEGIVEDENLDMI